MRQNFQGLSERQSTSKKDVLYIKRTVTILVLFALFSLSAFAHDHTQFSLPKGVKARLGKSTISNLQYSPDGTRLAVASDIGICLYDTATHQEVALLRGHTDEVRSVAFSPDGRTLASGSWGEIRLWNASTGDELRALEGRTSSILSVAFSPDGHTLASGSMDGTVLLWELGLATTTWGNIKRIAVADITRHSLALSLSADMIIPVEMALLPNYPNPFNPETWIPYQLATSAEVTLTIYNMNGGAVRRLEVGHQAAGLYQSRNRAAYWDGRNGRGEFVASGIYFYMLKAGEFTATRKMLIRK